MTAHPDLAIIIPVHNAADNLSQLVHDCLSIDGVEVEVWLVDDGSTDGSDRIAVDLAARYQAVEAICLPANRGAGVARNEAFARVRGRYTLFFDADDILHPETLTAVIPHLDESGADLGFMAYRYRRGQVVASEAMNDRDIKIWARALDGSHRRTVHLDEVPALLGFSNYPWNKVLRTAVYREAGLRFGDTPVHNDILGHWYSLLFAKTLLLLDEVVCTHIVDPDGRSLSNRKDAQRLALFDALDETYRLLEQSCERRSKYADQYWEFVLTVTSWARALVGPTLEAQFDALLQDHLLKIRIFDFATMRVRRKPSVARRVVEKVFR